ncbi:MAG: hypothetical protein LBQ40_03900 [Clostridiales bacterium]|jgi:valyl-tRNA synthetase|nr:hypothetical protein [Clostridiales bacterium]
MEKTLNLNTHKYRLTNFLKTSAGLPPTPFFMFEPELIENGGGAVFLRLWETARFVIVNGSLGAVEAESLLPDEAYNWFAVKLDALFDALNACGNDAGFAAAKKLLIEFFDKNPFGLYVLLSKSRAYSDGTKNLAAVFCAMNAALERLLRGLEPFLPYTCGRLLRYKDEYKGGAAACDFAYARDAEKAAGFDVIADIAAALCAIRAEYSTGICRKTDVFILTKDGGTKAAVLKNLRYITASCNADARFLEEGTPPPRGAKRADLGSVDIFVPLSGLIDLSAEVERLNARLRRAEDELARLDGFLLNPDYAAKASKEAVEKERKKRGHYESERREVCGMIEYYTNAGIL